MATELPDNESKTPPASFFQRDPTEATSIRSLHQAREDSVAIRQFRPVLICLSGSHRGTRRPIESPDFVLGRGSDADWQIEDSAASRRHAMINYTNVAQPMEIPHCTIEDLGSRNGTQLNGQNIQGPVVLRERDRVMIGSTVIGFFIRDNAELAQDESLYLSATSDVLTGLDNRRQFRTQLRSLLARARRQDITLSFLLIDVDHFKTVNDTHGHDVGDEALCHLANIMRTATRESDIVARWGGEEFAICLVDTGEEHARAFAERLRKGIEINKLELDEGDFLSMTVSVGGTEFRKGDTADSIFQRADQQLYRAKNTGRNRVCFDSDSA